MYTENEKKHFEVEDLSSNSRILTSLSTWEADPRRERRKKQTGMDRQRDVCLLVVVCL